MPEKIIQRKCFVINTAYILIAAMLVLLTILTAGLLMPFWIALFLSAILQPITRLLSGKLGLKRKDYQQSYYSYFICCCFVSLSLV